MIACLGIDTATSRGSVALAADGIPPIIRLLEKPAGHAQDLLAAIDRLLGEAGMNLEGVRGIGVAAGPGSFTGLRVGMATAKGIAFARNIPLEGISSLEAMARAVAPRLSQPTCQLAVAIPAGRGEVYGTLFDVEGGHVRRVHPDRLWAPQAFLESLPDQSVVAGESLNAMAREIHGDRLRPAGDLPPLAGAIAAWAATALPPGGAYRPGRLVPNYVRPSDVEVARRHD